VVQVEPIWHAEWHFIFRKPSHSPLFSLLPVEFLDFSKQILNTPIVCAFLPVRAFLS